MELCLGTVQLGLDYGIEGGKKPCFDGAVRRLEYAFELGIRAYDTAETYGCAEEVLGKFISQNRKKAGELRIFSKMDSVAFDSPDQERWKTEIEKHLDETLTKLQIDHIDTFLLHNAKRAYSTELLEILAEIQKTGKVIHTGVSVYEVDEALACKDLKAVNYIQMPFGLLDQRMKNAGLFNKRNDLKIAVRSIFTQGLLFMEESRIPNSLEGIKPYIKVLDELCKKWGYSAYEIAVGYVKSNQSIDYLVFGTDTGQQIEEMVKVYEKVNLSSELVLELETYFSNIDKKLVVPTYW